MSSKSKKSNANRGLGRGLGNLLDTSNDINKGINKGAKKDPTLNELVFINVNKIKANPDNPRKKFAETAISELAKTIDKFGLLQPILVQPDGENYMVISGERRLRACRHLKIAKIPCIIKKLESQENLEISLIENIQREQLDPIEEGNVYKDLIEKYNMTQESLSERVGKNRSTIANRIRLLQLPNQIRAALADGRITEGQARPLLSISNKPVQLKLAMQIMNDELNSRQVEELIKTHSGKKQNSKVKSKTNADKESERLAEAIGEYLQTRVFINHSKSSNKGSVKIDYYSLEELDRILDSMGFNKKDL